MKDGNSRVFVLNTIGGDVVCVTPQFTRIPGSPVPGKPPTTLEEWNEYRSLKIEDLTALGFGDWDGSLALIPGDWLDSMPKGLSLESISGRQVTVGEDYIDQDIRFGCLAYGFRCRKTTQESK